MSHTLHFAWDNGWEYTITCPDEAMGNKRPCAVWDGLDTDDRLDECTFQQYAEACDLEDWLHGTVTFPPVAIEAGGSGDDWHARIVKAGQERTADTASPADDTPDQPTPLSADNLAPTSDTPAEASVVAESP